VALTVFPEIDSFVDELRAHFHAVGLPNADEAAADYRNAIAGMYRATIGNPPGSLPRV